MRFARRRDSRWGCPGRKRKSAAPALPRSAVDQPAIGCTARLHYGLREGRVAMDRARDLRVTALEQSGVDQLLDHLGRFRPDDVSAEQLAVAFLSDDLHQSRPVAITGSCPPGALTHLSHAPPVAPVSAL